MLVRILKWIVYVPVAVILILFAVANRQIVTVSLDPLGGDPPVMSVTAPMFVVLLIVLVLGVIVGGFAAWLRQSRWRRAARENEAHLRRLRREEAQRQAETLPSVADVERRP